MKATIKWLGHACWKLTLGDYTIVIDPFEPGSVPGIADVNETANLCLCSHGHHDHGYAEAVNILPGDDAGVKVTRLDSFHDDVQGSKRGPNIIHMVEFGGLRIVHFGDLGCELTPEQVDVLKGADVVMIPVGGFFTVGPEEAKATALAIEAKTIIPMHYRSDSFGFDVIGTVEAFTELWDKELVKENGCDTLVLEGTPEHQVLVMSYGR